MPDRRLLLVLLLVAAPALSPGASAQGVGFECPCDYLRVDINSTTGFVEVPWTGQRTVGLTVEDISGDNYGGTGFPHVLDLSARIENPNITGWSVHVDPTTAYITSGESVDARLVVDSDPIVRTYTITVNVTAELRGADDDVTRRSHHIQARVGQYHHAQMDVLDTVGRMEPFESTVVRMEVRNLAPYPDTYDLELTAPDGWTVNAPERVSLMQEARQFHDIQVVAPHGDDQLYYRGSSDIVRLELTTAADGTDPVTLDDEAFQVRVQGFYVPPFMWPFFPLGLLLAAALTRRRVRSFRRRRKEKGPPRDPQLSPRKQALLAELKERNPEAYRKYKRKIDEARDRREEAYPRHREAQLESLLEDGKDADADNS